MPIITLKTQIKANIKTCFDLARNIDFHQQSMEHSKERSIAGKTAGLIELGESVTWEATHFRIKQQLTSKITEFNYPYYFVDEMVSGAFKSFKHEHIFEEKANYILMTDRFTFESPYGMLGQLANLLFLKNYMRNLLKTRNEVLKSEAERVS